MKKKWLLPLLRRRIVVGLLVLAQAALFVYFLVSTSRVSSVLSGAFSAVSVLVALFVLAGKGESSYKLTWIFVILIFPVVGGILYLSLDQHFLRHALMRRTRAAEERTKPYLFADGATPLEDSLPRAIKYLANSAGFPAYSDTESTFLPSQTAAAVSSQELSMLKIFTLVHLFYFKFV